jgi:hypothetical protein
MVHVILKRRYLIKRNVFKKIKILLILYCLFEIQILKIIKQCFRPDFVTVCVDMVFNVPGNISTSQNVFFHLDESWPRRIKISMRITFYFVGFALFL